MMSCTRPSLRLTLLFIILLVVSAPTVRADWGYAGWKTIFQPVNKSPEFKAVPDGGGGTLVIVNDPGNLLFPVSVLRLGHTGDELWGPAGRVIPVDPLANGMAGPVDIVDDGAQGAFCIFSRFYGASQILYLTHLAADGTVTMTVPVGDFGANPVPAASLVKADNGDLLVSWNRSVGSLDLELITVRVAPDGSIAWEVTVWADNNNNYDQLNWVSDSDGFGGVVFGINYHPFSGLWEGRVQRLAGNGSVMWGPRGDQAFGSLGTVVDVLPDNAGGAYVMNSLGWGETRVQHVDALGAETWIAGGVQVFNLGTWPDPSQPQFCIDGGGGFFAVDGITDLFAQHVDIYGNLTWGATGLQITSLAGWQDAPGIFSDGFGGVVIAYEDHYYSALNDGRPRAVSAVRLDGFGTKVWETTGFWWAIVNDMSGYFVAEPKVVPDGSGGALVIWNLYDDAMTTSELLAAGLGPDGVTPPVPTLAYINPDAGSVGQVQGALVLGDYLDASLTFRLTRSGAPDLPLTGLTTLSGQLVAGDLDLTAAQFGAYDLQVSNFAGVRATLANAYGVGEMVPCDQDEPLPTDAQAEPFGSQRRMAIDSQGGINAAWIDYHEGQYHLVWNVQVPGSSETQQHIFSSVDQLRDLSLAVGPGDEVYFVFVQVTAGGDFLVCQTEDPVGGSTIAVMPVTGDGHNPVVAVDALGKVQIVYQADNSGLSELYHVTMDPSGFDAPVFLNAGTNAGYPDLTRDGTGLMLTFVRDFWWPGQREVCYQHFDGVNWDSPVGVYFGLYVESPSVAWDGADKLLFSWVLDNTSLRTAPLLHTLLMENHVAGAVRWRTGLTTIYKCSVASNGPGNFQMLTLESDGSLPLQVYLRAGNGEVFYPRRRLNSSSDVDFPYLCSRLGYSGVAVMWDDYSNPALPLYRFNCFSAGGVSAVTVPVAAVEAGAYPNPFNPSTTLRFNQRVAGWAKLAVYDVAGRRVRSLVDGVLDAGNHAVTWDGRDVNGRGLPSGMYFGRLQLPGGQPPAVIKLTLLK